jgi:hypothetical protein
MRTPSRTIHADGCTIGPEKPDGQPVAYEPIRYPHRHEEGTTLGMRTLALLAVALAAAFAAGCGGSDDGAAAEPAATATAAEQPGEESEGDGSENAAGPTASLSGDLVSQDFTVTSCENQGEADLVLEATADAFALSVDAPDGTGTIAYTGGNEGDAIDLSGAVSSVVVGDAGDFTVEGAWDSGEVFTLTGSCAG